MNRYNYKLWLTSTILLFIITANMSLRAQSCSVNAGGSITICPNELPVTLNGNISPTTSVPSSVVWSLGSYPAGAEVEIGSPQSLSTSINGTMPEGNYVFVLGVSCTDGFFVQDSMTLTITTEPTVAAIDPTAAFGCYDGTGIPLNANVGTGGETVAWRVVSGEAGFFDNPLVSSPTFFPQADSDECKTGPNGYASRLEYRIINGNCFSSDFVDVTFTDAKDSFNVFTTSILTCGFCTDLFASCALDGVGQWTFTGPGNAVFGDSNANNTGVCVDAAGEYTFTWTVTGGCRPDSKSTTIYFQEFGVEGFGPNAGEDHVYCEIPPSISLTATPLGNGQLGSWFQIKGAPAVIVDPSSPSTQIDSLQESGSPYWFLWAVTGIDCVMFDTVKVETKPALGFSDLFDLACATEINIFEDEIVNTAPVPFGILDDFELTITFLEVPQGYGDKIVFYPQAKGSSPGSVTSASLSLDVFNDGSPKDTAQLGVPFVYNIPAELVFQKVSSSVLAYEEFSFLVIFDRYQPRGYYNYVVTLSNSCGSKSFEREYTNSGFSRLEPKAGSDVRLNCGVTSTSLAGTGLLYPDPTDPVKIHAGVWNTISAPSGANPIDDSNRFSTNPLVDSLEDGVYEFRYIGIFGDECNLSYDNVKVYASTGLPSGVNAYLNQALVCGTGVAQLIGEKGTSTELGTWSQLSPAVTTEQMLVTTTRDTVYLFGLIPNTSYAFVYTNNNSCGSESDTVYFMTNGLQGPSLSNISEEFSCIAVGSYDLVADTVVFGQGTWSVVSAPAGASPVFSIPDSNITTISGLTEEGVYRLKFSISNPPCTVPSEDYIEVVVGDAPLLSAGENIYDCQLSFPHTVNVMADSATSGTAYWRFLTGPSIPEINDIYSPTTAITFKTAGKFILEWVSAYGPCSEEVDLLEVILGEVSTVAQAGIDQEACGSGNNGVFTLDALDLTPSESGAWSVASTTGNMSVYFTDSSDPNTQVTLSGNGVAVLQWTTFGKTSACGSTDDQVVLEWHAPAFAGDDIVVCNANNVELIANNYSGVDTVDVAWSLVSGPTTPVFETPTNSHTIAKGLIPGIYVFNHEVTTNLCTTNDDLRVEVVAVDTAVVDIDQVVCNGAVFPLSGNTGVTGASTWYLLDGENTGTFSNINSNTTTYGPAATNDSYVFAYSLDNGSCVTYDYTKVFVLDDSDVTNTFTYATCGNSNGTISLDIDDLPTDLLSFSWSNGETTQNISNLAAGVYHVTISSASSCEYEETIPLANSDGPLLGFGSVQSICPGETAPLSPAVTGGTPPYSFLWESGETTSSILVSPTGETDYQVTVTDAANCTNIDFTTIVVNSIAAVDLGTDFSRCGETVLLTPNVIPPAGFTEVGPFNENDFDTGFKDWTQGVDDDIDWAINNPGTGAGSANSYAEGTASVDQAGHLYSPVVDLSSRINVSFNFEYSFSGAFARDFYLEISTDSAATWSSLWSVPGISSTFINQKLDLNPYAGMPSVQLRFVAVTGSPSKCFILLNRVAFEDTKSAYDFIWSTGDTAQGISIETDSSKHYQVTVTDPNGCRVSDEIQVTGCLPITLSYFRGEADQCRVKVFWETQEEIDVAYFEVERSEDGQDYISVGSLQASGGQGLRQYEIWDEMPENINYYRLKIVNRDQTVEYHQNQISITACYDKDGIAEVYPNPTAGDQIYLKYHTQRAEPVTIEILDVNGQTKGRFEKIAGNNDIEVNIKNLPAGLYFVKLIGSTGISKFVRM